MIRERGTEVAKYLITASYSQHGITGVFKEGGTARVKTIEGLLSGMGGNLEAFYFAFGDTDCYLIVDLPDNVTAAALGAAVAASGSVTRYETVVLLTPADIDAAAKVSVGYRPPGS
jgi:uncharacterized protein with GYD domain